MTSSNRSTHIRLTSHPEPNTGTIKHPIKWGAKDPKERGPIIGSVTNPAASYDDLNQQYIRGALRWAPGSVSAQARSSATSASPRLPACFAIAASA